jgi:uncharacterized membrane protein
MDLIPLLFETIGTLMIAFAALRVHYRVLTEKTLDKVVFRSIRKEFVIGIVGSIFVLTSFILEVLLRFY